MVRPPTLADARKQKLLTADGQGIHTFSSGSEWECWASGNCDACRWYDKDSAGALCAFEAAAFLGIASPDLARLFGWTRNEANKQDGERFGWDAPETCRFFRDKDKDEGGEPPPPPDPSQLVLLADPTEDAEIFAHAPAVEREAVPA